MRRAGETPCHLSGTVASKCGDARDAENRSELEPRIGLRHPSWRFRTHDLPGELMSRFYRTFAFGLLLLPAMASAQVTNGKKPQLPAPFATKSAGNPPEESMPPKGFMPTVPAGFKINMFATDFDEPRWMVVA